MVPFTAFIQVKRSLSLKVSELEVQLDSCRLQVEHSEEESERLRGELHQAQALLRVAEQGREEAEEQLQLERDGHTHAVQRLSSEVDQGTSHMAQMEKSLEQCQGGSGCKAASWSGRRARLMLSHLRTGLPSFPSRAPPHYCVCVTPFPFSPALFLSSPHPHFNPIPPPHTLLCTLFPIPPLHLLLPSLLSLLEGELQEHLLRAQEEAVQQERVAQLHQKEVWRGAGRGG